MLKKLTVLFAFALFVLVVGWAVMPVQAGHCKGKHKNDDGCDSNDGDSGRPDFDLAILTVVDNPAFAVSGDEVRTTGVSTIYEDSNVTPPDDPCVVAGVLPHGKGSFWIDFAGVESDFCPDANLLVRTYFLSFPAGVDACGELFDNDGSSCELNAQCPTLGREEITEDNVRFCNGNAWMRVEKLFSKTATTPVRFSFRIDKDGVFDQYEVITDDNVPINIDPNNSNMRTLNYVGGEATATLFGPDGFVSDPFILQFELTVKRVPQ